MLQPGMATTPDGNIRLSSAIIEESSPRSVALVPLTTTWALPDRIKSLAFGEYKKGLDRASLKTISLHRQGDSLNNGVFRNI